MKSYYIIILLCLLFCGCKPFNLDFSLFQGENLDGVSKAINDSLEKSKNNVKGIQENMSTSSYEIDEIRDYVRNLPNSDSKIISTSDVIKDKIEDTYHKSLDLEVQLNNIDDKNSVLSDMSDNIKELEEENQKLKEDEEKEIKYLFYLLVALGVLSLASGGVLLIIMGNKIGFSMIALGAVLIAFGAILFMYLDYFIYVSVASCVVVLTFWLYSLYQNGRLKILSNKMSRAFEETVETVEEIKKNVNEEVIEKVIRDKAHKIQSDETEKLINEFKEKKKGTKKINP